MRAIKIPTAGPVEEVEWDHLAEVGAPGSIQSIIGGFVEPVHPMGQPGYLLLVDEEGLLKNLAPNLGATLLAGRGLLVGDALVVGDSETMELPDDITVESITDVINKYWERI